MKGNFTVKFEANFVHTQNTRAIMVDGSVGKGIKFAMFIANGVIFVRIAGFCLLFQLTLAFGGGWVTNQLDISFCMKCILFTINTLKFAHLGWWPGRVLHWRLDAGGSIIHGTPTRKQFVRHLSSIAYCCRHHSGLHLLSGLDWRL